MMKNYDQSVRINYNPNWPYIPDHPYRILIIVGSRSGKTNVLLNLTKHQQPDIDIICLYIKGPLESKYQFFINSISTSLFGSAVSLQGGQMGWVKLPPSFLEKYLFNLVQTW